MTSKQSIFPAFAYVDRVTMFWRKIVDFRDATGEKLPLSNFLNNLFHFLNYSSNSTSFRRKLFVCYVSKICDFSPGCISKCTLHSVENRPSISCILVSVDRLLQPFIHVHSMSYIRILIQYAWYIRTYIHTYIHTKSRKDQIQALLMDEIESSFTQRIDKSRATLQEFTSPSYTPGIDKLKLHSRNRQAQATLQE